MLSRTRGHFGPVTNFGVVEALNNLPHGEAVALGTINVVTLRPAVDLQVYLRLVLGASGVSETGWIEVLLLESFDNTTWRDGINGNASGDQAANIKTLRSLMTLNATANDQVIEDWFSLVGMKGNKPDYLLSLRPYLSLLVLNKSGADLPGSGHAASYVAVNLEVFDI